MEIQAVANFLRSEAEEISQHINAGHSDQVKARVIETAQIILAEFPTKLDDEPLKELIEYRQNQLEILERIANSLGDIAKMEQTSVKLGKECDKEQEGKAPEIQQEATPGSGVTPKK